ncbi:Hypothetical_protein [Hexamita inflata]|uniref:Hypothetical_protein n=1 Tax=Hexamita inflata TaxID=28002 RepID=A0AA86P2G1_9EUKA|nr:Hypothetical protein HINF_LOCUS16582 [Hexamita inflata]
MEQCKVLLPNLQSSQKKVLPHSLSPVLSVTDIVNVNLLRLSRKAQLRTSRVTEANLFAVKPQLKATFFSRGNAVWFVHTLSKLQQTCREHYASRTRVSQRKCRTRKPLQQGSLCFFSVIVDIRVESFGETVSNSSYIANNLSYGQ